MEKVIISCSACDAEYEIKHELGKPYVSSFCPFCGEEIEKDFDWGGRWGECDNEFDDYEEYDN